MIEWTGSLRWIVERALLQTAGEDTGEPLAWSRNGLPALLWPRHAARASPPSSLQPEPQGIRPQYHCWERADTKWVAAHRSFAGIALGSQFLFSSSAAAPAVIALATT